MYKVKLHVFWLDSRSQPSALLSTGRCPAKGRRVVGRSLLCSAHSSSRLSSPLPISLLPTASCICVLGGLVGILPGTWHHHLHLLLEHRLFDLQILPPFTSLLPPSGRLVIRRVKFQLRDIRAQDHACEHVCSHPTRSGRIPQ